MVAIGRKLTTSIVIAAASVWFMSACGGSGYLGETDFTGENSESVPVRLTIDMGGDNVLLNNLAKDAGGSSQAGLDEGGVGSVDDALSMQCLITFEAATAGTGITIASEDQDADLDVDIDDCIAMGGIASKCLVCQSFWYLQDGDGNYIDDSTHSHCVGICEGQVPANAATAADAIPADMHFYTDIVTDILSVGSAMIRQDGTVTDFDEAIITNIEDDLLGVDFYVLDGCDGTDDMLMTLVDPIEAVLGNPTIDANDGANWSKGFSVDALDPTPSAEGSECSFETVIHADVPLTGADLGAVDLTRGPVVVNTMFCDDMLNCEKYVEDTPLVLGMNKTSNASLSPGTITISVQMSEVLEAPPTAVSEEQESDAIEISECTLHDGGERADCDLTVAACDDSTDYFVTISGGISAVGGEMEPYTLWVNSSDSEFYDMDDANVCWTKYVGEPGDEQGFDDVATISIEGDSLVWNLFGFPGDMAQANLFKTFDGVESLAVVIKADTGITVGDENVALTGIQFSPLPAPNSLSEFYKINAGGLVATTYTDDATGTFYFPTTIDIRQDRPFYSCIVRNGEDLAYFLSEDGISYTQLTSDNTQFIPDEESPGEPYIYTPIEGGWRCPTGAEMCNPNADWSDVEMRPYESLAACIIAVGLWSQMNCVDTGYMDPGSPFRYPILRIWSWGNPALDMPPIDFMRMRISNITGTATDCPTLY